MALLNENDEDFVRVKFNEADSKYFMNNISNIKEDINRLLIWFVLKDQVLKGTTSSQVFLESLFKAIDSRNPKSEKNMGIYEILTDLIYLMINTYTPKEFYEKQSLKMFDILAHSTNSILEDGDPNGLLVVNLSCLLYFVRNAK